MAEVFLGRLWSHEGAQEVLSPSVVEGWCRDVPGGMILWGVEPQSSEDLGDLVEVSTGGAGGADPTSSTWFPSVMRKPRVPKHTSAPGAKLMQ